jgi:hypothetical protein
VREPRIAAWRKPMKKSENESEKEEKRRREEGTEISLLLKKNFNK